MILKKCSLHVTVTGWPSANPMRISEWVFGAPKDSPISPIADEFDGLKVILTRLSPCWANQGTALGRHRRVRLLPHYGAGLVSPALRFQPPVLTPDATPSSKLLKCSFCTLLPGNSYTSFSCPSEAHSSPALPSLLSGQSHLFLPFPESHRLLLNIPGASAPPMAI